MVIAGATVRSKTAASIGLGSIGIWSSAVRYTPDDAGIAAAAKIEQMGFAAVWVPGGIDSGVLDTLDKLLDVTSTIKLGSSILNIWKHGPADVAAWWKKQSPERQSRLILGLGISHGPLIGDAYRRPLAKMRAFLDGLEATEMSLGRICIGAMGPMMLELASRRTAGSCPFLVSPRHTAFARKQLGLDALLAPELAVVLETNPSAARAIARQTLKVYVSLPNYTNVWLRDGYTQGDIDTLSDRLVDSLVAWGDLDAIGARVKQYIEAGADHVCLQPIGASGMGRPLAEDMRDWRILSGLLQA